MRILHICFLPFILYKLLTIFPFCSSNLPSRKFGKSFSMCCISSYMFARMNKKRKRFFSWLSSSFFVVVKTNNNNQIFNEKQRRERTDLMPQRPIFPLLLLIIYRIICILHSVCVLSRFFFFFLR